ncbi:MAG: MCE family protein [Deltaproteobacteria bacterium]|nr:MCE family protein [Deltaproteobacteria bacterium]
MAQQKSSFLVGLFVIIGTLLTVGAIIWIGVTGYFLPGDTYVTYLDESVQGLQRDSVVKFRGVDVGRVEQIRIAPDNKLVAIIMKINMPEDVSKSAVAQLTSAGITGLMFVDLDHRKPDEPDLSPKITFPSEYPVIPSKPSEFARIMHGVNEIINRLNQIDVQGISDQLKATLDDIGAVFRGEHLNSILIKVDKAAANLDSLTARATTILGDVKVNEIIKEATATVAETRSAMTEAKKFIAGLEHKLDAMKLPETMTRTRGLLMEAQLISENLKRASESMEQFTDRIADRPPDLLFGKPPQPRWNERPGRQP